MVVDPENIKAIMEWPNPRNLAGVRSFMGLVCYYRWFIGNFTKIWNPIIALQRKGEQFQWTPECAASFQQLKKLLTCEPILRITNPTKYFVVCTDVCKEGLYGVLMQ